MNLEKLQELNKKAPKASKDELSAFLNSVGVPFEAMKVGDKIKFPADISATAGTLVKGVVNGNSFYSVAVERNGTEAVNVSVTSFSRRFNDIENGKVITPIDILPEDKKDKAVFSLFTDQTRAEALRQLQGREATLEALETFESVDRTGAPIRVNVMGWITD